MAEITRIPVDDMRTKSKVAIYRFPGGGGLMWAVATSRDSSLDLPGQAANALEAIDGYLKEAGLSTLR